MASPRLTIRLDTEVLESLKALAEETGNSPSGLVQEALNIYLKYRWGVQALTDTLEDLRVQVNFARNSN